MSTHLFLKLRWFLTGFLFALVGVVLVAAQDRKPATAPPTFHRPVAATPPVDGKLRIIAFGAHPDDCELKVAGTGAKWAALGHHVKFVSVTNGDIGHWGMAGGPLAQRPSGPSRAITSSSSP